MKQFTTSSFLLAGFRIDSEGLQVASSGFWTESRTGVIDVCRGNVDCYPRSAACFMFAMQ